FCFLAEVSPFITILLLLQLVQMSFGAIRTPNISKNKNLSVSHLLTLPFFLILPARKCLLVEI
ncbi:hypothetical protein HZB02_05030, partial [Candidatus Woesearchaeota archaeon]|nr:hypothetical protein [Candidatus Woesearchaeota archaeon]